MDTTEKRPYAPPVVEVLATVTEVTAALGEAAHEDQSEYPAFPPSHGSFDICNNDDPVGIC